MRKRVQISVYFIIGFVLVIILIFLFYLRSIYQQEGAEQQILKTSTVPTQFQDPVKNIETCVDNFLFNTIILFGNQGLCLNCKDTINYFGSKIQLYKEGKTTSINEWEQDFSSYIRTNLPNRCSLEAQGIQINYDNPTINTKILANKITFTVNWPVTLSKSGITSSVEDFSNEYNIRLGGLKIITDQLLAVLFKEPLCLSCIADINTNNNIFLSILPYNESVMYTIVDNKEAVRDNYYTINIAR